MNYKNTWNNICLSGSIICIVIGIIMIVLPNLLLKFLSIFSGAALLSFGIVQIIQGVAQIDVKLLGKAKVTFGIIFSIIGLMFFINPKSPYRLFSFCFGIWAIITGFTQTNMYLKIKTEGIISPYFLVKGILNTIFGLMILLFPITITTIWTQIIGAYVIFVGVNLLTETIGKNKNQFF